MTCIAFCDQCRIVDKDLPVVRVDITDSDVYQLAHKDCCVVEDASWMTTAGTLLETARNIGWHLHRRSYTCHDCHMNGQANYLS